ncbi:MAG: hypothetical protein WBE26_06190 [Phycisphaerae bacterium]
MSKEYYVDESGGLFGRQIACRATGVDDMKAVLKQAMDAAQPEAVFDRIEHGAREILRRHGFDNWPIRSKALPLGVPKDADPIVKDADSILWGIKIIREQIADCHTPEAAAVLARNAIQLGMDAQRARLRVFETPAEIGMEVLVRFRGRWIEVTELERRLLDFMSNRAEASIVDFVRAGWNELYNRGNRSKYDKAMSQLNRKLLDYHVPGTFGVDGDKVTISE